MKSSNFDYRNVGSKVVKSRNSRKKLGLDEIICINKESNFEALIALMAGFLSDSLKDEDIEDGVVSVVGRIDQYNNILIINHIIMKWRENLSIWLTKDRFIKLYLNDVVCC